MVGGRYQAATAAYPSNAGTLSKSARCPQPGLNEFSGL